MKSKVAGNVSGKIKWKENYLSLHNMVKTLEFNISIWLKLRIPSQNYVTCIDIRVPCWKKYDCWRFKFN